MTIERAKRLAEQWASGGVCSLREGEAEEYHKMFLEMLLEKKARESNLKALERKTCWISVNDRLPEEAGKYLVNIHGEDDTDTCDFVTEAWYNPVPMILFAEDAGWTLLNAFYDCTVRLREQITHWMPWPEPPEVDNEPTD